MSGICAAGFCEDILGTDSMGLHQGPHHDPKKTALLQYKWSLTGWSRHGYSCKTSEEPLLCCKTKLPCTSKQH